MSVEAEGSTSHPGGKRPARVHSGKASKFPKRLCLKVRPYACFFLFLYLSSGKWRCVRINDLMINEEIRDREVRLIDQNGEQMGIMPTRKAMELAEQAGLDLVKIAPQAKPPVCKLMDYGKYRFEQSKKEREIRKNQKVITIKEVRLSAVIADHDFEVRVKQGQKFLQDGDKVKASIRFRGRQIAHSQIGMEVMNAFAERLKDIAVVERKPLIEGRNMAMVLAPKEVKEPKPAKAAPAPAAPAEG